MNAELWSVEPRGLTQLEDHVSRIHVDLMVTIETIQDCRNVGLLTRKDYDILKSLLNQAKALCNRMSSVVEDRLEQWGNQGEKSAFDLDKWIEDYTTAIRDRD